MTTRIRPRHRRLALVAMVATASAAVVALSGPSSADVSAVKGSAYGYYVSVAIFGPNPMTKGPEPTAMLPAGGSANPVTATQQSSLAQFGPAVVFSSGPLNVSTQGTTGATGAVASSASVTNVNASGQETFTAAGVNSMCTASETGRTSGVTITNGVLRTDSGLALNDDDDYTDAGEHAPIDVDVPASPAPGTTFTGHVHLSPTSVDEFRYVFNEQTLAADGTMTVNAGHQYLLGPTAKGDVIVAQSVCGITVTTSSTTTSTVVASTTSTLPPSTTSTVPPSTTTTVPPSTTSTVPPSTTTTVPPSTTTTVPPSTTTTVPPSTTTTTRVPNFVKDLICLILGHLRAIPFLRSFIDPLLAVFGCPAAT